MLIPTKRLTAKAVLAHPWLAFDHKTAQLGRWRLKKLCFIAVEIKVNVQVQVISRVTRLETSRMRRHLARWRWMVIRKSIQVIPVPFLKIIWNISKTVKERQLAIVRP